jgi:hypothetical protein
MDKQGAEFIETMKGMMAELAEEYDLEGKVGELPERYVRFLTSGEYKTYEQRSTEIFADEPHTFRFTHDYLFEFATSEKFDSIIEEVKDPLRFWPLSQVWGDTMKSSSVGLFIDLSKPACPVQLWDEGTLTDVAGSLDEFLAKLDGPAIEIDDDDDGDDEDDEDEGDDD